MGCVQEQWHLIAETLDRYEVSDQGRVRSRPYVITLRGQRAGEQRRVPGKILTPGAGPDGHLYVFIGSVTDGTRHRRAVHHLVLETFIGPRPPGQESLHGNGDSADNRRRNLRWGTRSQNQSDAVRHGTHTQARKTHCARHGHLLTAPNLTRSLARKGYRGCLACARATSLVHNAKIRRGVDLDHKEWADRYYAEIMAA